MNTKQTAGDFVVRRNDLRQSKFIPAPDADQIELRSGQALLRVDRFALTANNISYAVVGELMSYWQFFPTEEGWGRIPVWGFADVVRSACDGVREGERLFGYFPMSNHLVVQPDSVTPGSFVDASPHRQALPPVYNQYTRVAGDPLYRPDREDEQMLLWPLFMTSFLIDDFLDESDFFGAHAVVLASASSKTAFGLAFLLAHNRKGKCEVVGLTSPRNAGFVERLGCYDRTVTYEHISTLSKDLPIVFVDMAGNGAVLSAVHRHFGDNVKHSCLVGATHWEDSVREGELPGAEPAFFFAPTRVQKRVADWGPGGLQKRFAESWTAFVDGRSNGFGSFTAAARPRSRRCISTRSRAAHRRTKGMS